MNPPAPKPAAARPASGAKPRSLYRAVLSLAVAAVIAASIPFAAIYAGMINHPPAIPTLTAGPSGSHTRLVTTASGRQIAVPASGNGSTAAGALPVTTHTSGSRGQD